MDARARTYAGARAVSWKFVETMKTKITLQRRLQRGILISSNGAAVERVSRCLTSNFENRIELQAGFFYLLLVKRNVSRETERSSK